MRLLRHKWLCAVLGVMVAVDSFLLLWFCTADTPDDAVHEIPIGASDWYLAEHCVGSKAYYTIRSARGNTSWDKRYGNRPASLLYYQLADDGTLLLQRIDGSVLRLDLLSGSWQEAPVPDTPLAPLSVLFSVE